MMIIYGTGLRTAVHVMEQTETIPKPTTADAVPAGSSTRTSIRALVTASAGMIGVNGRQRSLLKARLAEVRNRRRMPPGDFIPLHPQECRNRHILLQKFQIHGPIFRTFNWGNVWVCIQGIDRCRRFIREHDDSILPGTFDLTALVPQGFMRAMEGDTHRHYRNALVTSLAASGPLDDPEAIRRSVEERFREMEAEISGGADPAQALRSALYDVATRTLLDIVFGTSGRPDIREKLQAAYVRLGPDHVVFKIGTQQQELFHEIRGLVDELRGSVTFDSSAAGHADRRRLLDDTMIGNMIYMVESGRHDIASLLRWAFRDLSHDVESQDALAAGDARALQVAGAFVQETLRLNQIERLTRIAKRDLVFDGWLIPKGTYVRLCLWEAHKDPERFHQPFEHRPARFLEGAPTRDDYAPFGLDKHNCPFATTTLRLCSLVMTAVCARWRLSPLNDGPPVRNYYQWAPPVAFAVALTPRG